MIGGDDNMVAIQIVDDVAHNGGQFIDCPANCLESMPLGLSIIPD